MNYPVWDVSFGAGLLIAIVAITHVFVSHFAVGGGLFLVLTELKAYREEDSFLLEWLKRHTIFFVLVTVVFGAISGVGIWFTIGLIHPAGTSSLIHSFVWGWAIEWIFFFLEITASLLYLYGWQRLDRRTHLWFGWIYFGAAFLSLVVINGIITYMLTPGKWLTTHAFWDGFFNPTYFPSLVFRFVFALALAGIYALITGCAQRDQELKAKIIKWSAKWIVPAFIVIPLAALWYIGKVPTVIWASALGKMPTASRYANLILIFSALTFLLSLLTLVKPKKTPFILALLVFLAAFGAMGSFEFIREAIRKPYIIYDFMYANSVYKNPVAGDAGLSRANIDEQGVLATAKWAKFKQITSENELAVGHDIFRLECQSCHTIDGYRGLKKNLAHRKWGYTEIHSRLSSLDKMYNGVMPPFAGTEVEKIALARFLVSLSPLAEEEEEVPTVATGEHDGAAVFNRFCSDCHTIEATNPLFVKLGQHNEKQIAYFITKLDSLNADMPPFAGTDAEREVLAEWISAQFK